MIVPTLCLRPSILFGSIYFSVFNSHVERLPGTEWPFDPEYVNYVSFKYFQNYLLIINPADMIRHNFSSNKFSKIKIFF